MWLLVWLVTKKPNVIVTKLFILGGKLNISIGFITRTYFQVAKDVRLNCTILD